MRTPCSFSEHFTAYIAVKRSKNARAPNARLVTADKVDTGPDLFRLRRAVQEGYVNRILFADDEPLRAGCAG